MKQIKFITYSILLCLFVWIIVNIYVRNKEGKRNIENLKFIRIDMSYEEVTKIMGNPKYSMRFDSLLTLTYAPPISYVSEQIRLSFDNKRKLIAITEPE